MTLCVLLARQRSGTGALGSTLDQHPQISYLGEVFHHDAMDKPPNYFWWLRQAVGENADMAMPNSGPARWERYAEYLKANAKKPNQIVDIKYSSTHHFNHHWLSIGDTPTLFNILRTRNVPIIHLLRRNYLKVFISGKLAEANGVWHAKHPHEAKVSKLRVEPNQFLKFAMMRGEEDERVNRALKDYPKLLTLEYARLFDASGALNEESSNQITAFFGLPPTEFKPPVFVKQTSDVLSDVVENYADLERAMMKTANAWMLYAN
jgi:hypothetical protein